MMMRVVFVSNFPLLCVCSVWQHLLLQFCAASAVLLPRFPGEGPAVQAAAEEPEKGITADMFGRPLLQHRYPEEEGRHHCTQKVHHQIEEREWWVPPVWMSHVVDAVRECMCALMDT